MAYRRPDRSKGTSPYVRYGKAPYDYSGMYRRLIDSGEPSPLRSHLLHRSKGGAGATITIDRKGGARQTRSIG